MPIHMSAPVALRRKKYLLSGLVRCGQCGGNMTFAGTGVRRAYYCANAKEKGPSVCSGLPDLRIDRLQPLVLASLRDELMTPEAVERFRKEYQRQTAEAQRMKPDDTAGLRKANAREQKAINGWLRAIGDDRATESVHNLLADAEANKKKFEKDLSRLSKDAVEIAPDLAELYRAHLDAISDTLSDPDIVHRASEILGDLIDSITVRYDADQGLTAILEGKLLRLLQFEDKRKAAFYEDAACSLKLVAGA